MLIKDAKKLYLGSTPATAVYAGSTKVWPGFTPNTLSGLTLWLDASQLGLADGAYVDTWPSLIGALVGTNFNVVPYRPVMRSNALNGKSVVRFSPGGGLRWPSTGLDLTSTVIYVSRMWQTSTPGRVLGAGYPPANISLGYHGGMEDKTYWENWLLPDVSHSVTTNWHLYSGTAEGVPGNATAWFYSNGVLLSGGQPGAVVGGWKGTFHLNGYGPTSGEETCYCEIAEVVMYNRRLTDPERVQVEGYLRAKWALT